MATYMFSCRDGRVIYKGVKHSEKVVQLAPIVCDVEPAASSQRAINPTALANVIATMRAARQEARAMRRELQHPPTGYSVALWQAYLCNRSELDDGQRFDRKPHHLAYLRARIESGAVEIPARILRYAGQLYGDAR